MGAEATDQIKGLPDTADRTPRRYPGVSELRNPGVSLSWVGVDRARQAEAVRSSHFVRKVCTSPSSSSEMLCERPV